MKIFDIKQEFEALNLLIEEEIEGIDSETGEFIDNAEDIRDLANELAVKRDDLVDYLANKRVEYGAEEKAIADEIKRLQGRKSSLNGQQKRLLDTIDYVLEGEKTKTLTHTFYYQMTKAVNILDETKIPAEYIDFKPSYDKTAIKKALADGEVEGAEIVETIGLRVK